MAPRARPRLRHALRRFPFGTLLVHASFAFAGAYGLYLVLVHVLILTPILPSLISTEDLKVEWTRAWSLWPGRVQLRGFQLRARDGGAEYYLAIPRAQASFDLVSLFDKTIDVRSIDAADVAFRMRPRLAEHELAPERLQGYPPIPGFADPPRKDPSPEPTSPPDQLWRVRLREADFSAREVWIGAFRWSGDATVHGGFHLHPTEALDVAPTTAKVRAGDIALDRRPFASETSGTLTARVHRVDPDDDVLAHLDATSTLGSRLEDLSFLQRWLRTTAFSASGGEGHVESDVRIERGALMPGSVVDVDARNAILHHPEATTTSDVRARVDVEQDEIRLAADLVEANVRRRWAEEWPITIPHATVIARAPSRELSEVATERLVVSATVPEASLHDVAVLRTFLPERAPIELGHARGVLHARATTTVHRGAVQGLLELETTERVPFSVAGVPMSGKIAGGVELAAFELGPMRGRIPGAHLELSEVSVEGDDPRKSWWGRVRFVEGRAHGAAGLVAEGTVIAHVKNARPILHVLAVKDQLPSWTRGLLDLDGLDAKAKLRWTEDGVVVRDFDAEAGAYDLEGRLSTEGEHLDAELSIVFGGFGVKIDARGGKTSVSPTID